MTKQKEEVLTISFRKKQVALKYTLFAVMKLEEQGVNIMEMEDTEEQNVTEIMKFIYAGLITDYPDVTVEEVAATYNLSDMEMLAKALAYGIQQSIKGK